ncbi:MAG: TetR/AcrR family transcriptional regulator [Phycisphaerae bacterium]
MAVDMEMTTKDRLLVAAGVLFAAKGYRETTVAEICDRAQANIASVNYHFGSKENLYVESWRAAFDEAIAKYPPQGDVPAEAPPERRLRARMKALLLRVTDPEITEFDILHREMGDPTGLLKDAFREEIDPIRLETVRTVRELLGPEASTGQVLMCTMSVMGPILHLAFRRRNGMFGEHDPHMPQEQRLSHLEVVIDHTLRFVLAGLTEARKGIVSGDWPDLQLSETIHERFRGAE